MHSNRDTLPKAEVLPRSLAEDVRGRIRPTHNVNDADVSHALTQRLIWPMKQFKII